MGPRELLSGGNGNRFVAVPAPDTDDRAASHTLLGTPTEAGSETLGCSVVGVAVCARADSVKLVELTELEILENWKINSGSRSFPDRVMLPSFRHSPSLPEKKCPEN